jgi:hypothetical protein
MYRAGFAARTGYKVVAEHQAKGKHLADFLFVSFG